MSRKRRLLQKINTEISMTNIYVDQTVNTLPIPSAEAKQFECKSNAKMISHAI